MASNKIKGLTISINGETTGLDKALSGINKKSRDLQGELREVEKLLKLDPGNTELLAQKQQLLAESVSNTSEKLDTLKTAAEQAQEKLANGEIGEDQYRALQREIVSAEQSLTKLESAQDNMEKSSADAAGATDDFAGSVDDATDKTLSFGDVVGGNLIADGIAAIGDAAKDVASELMDMASQTDAASGMIQAKLGLTAGAAENLTQIAKKVWTDGFGEDISGVTNNLSVVRQYLGDMADGELENILKKSYIISDVFGADVNESVKTVKIMMDNFGVSSDEAFDLITKGYQNGLDYSGEFLDTLNEYSPQFESMGLSAQDAMNLLIAGVDKGAFSLDKVADSMKEFNIRIKDGSNTTAEGLAALGINADDLTKKLADGTITTSDAMQLVIQKLADTDDKVQQNIAGTGLFGTQWEDVGSDVVLALGNTQDALGDVSGATDAAGDAAYDNLGTKFKTAVRELQDALAPLAEQMLDFANSVMPSVRSSLQWIVDHGPAIAASVTAIATAFAVIKIGGILTKIGGLAKLGAIIAAVGGPVTLVVAAIAAVVTAVITLWNTNEDFRNAVIGAWEGIKETASNVFGAIATFFTDTIPNAIQGMISWFQELPNRIGDALSAVVTAFGEWASSIGAWIAEAVPVLIESVVQFFNELPYKIGFALGSVLQAIVTFGLNALNWVKTEMPKIITNIVTFFQELPGKVYSAVSGVIQKLIDWVSGVIATVKTEVPKIISSIVNFYAELPGKIWAKLTEIVQGISAWVGNAVNTAKTEVPKIASAIAGVFAALPKQMLDIGLNVVKGLWDGIASASRWIKEKVGSFVQGVKDAFTNKNGFDTHSPSKWAFGIGTFVTTGLANGILTAKDKAIEAAKNVVTATQKVFDGITYEPTVDYAAQIDAAKLAGDMDKAAELERTRNAKIDGDKLSWGKTFNFQGLSDAVSTMGANASYATAPVQQSSNTNDNTDMAKMIADAVNQALLTGLAQVGDSIFDAIPKHADFNVGGRKIAQATWDDYDTEGRRRGKMFAPSREQIASIAMSVMPKMI